MREGTSPGVTSIGPASPGTSPGTGEGADAGSPRAGACLRMHQETPMPDFSDRVRSRCALTDLPGKTKRELLPGKG